MNIRNPWRREAERRQYWRTVPLPAFAWVVLACFFVFFSILFSADLVESVRWPFWWVLSKAACLGVLLALATAVGIRSRTRRRMFAGVLMMLMMLALPRIQSRIPTSQTLQGPAFEDVRRRLAIEGALSTAATMLGYMIFMVFAGTQGAKHVRVRTELDLAEKLQHTLAPPLAAGNAGYEIHGRSVPSSQMGGDLLDAVDDGQALACYVADVAGHGIQAGVFMGMVKSSVRTALLRPGPLEDLLADLNHVFLGIKGESATYVTFACLRCHQNGKVEYSLAGSGPILHYHSHSKTTSQLAMEQFPLGLFAQATFQSGLAEMQPGDILALLTDGLPEVTDRADEQLGMERIGEIVARNALDSLDSLTERLFAAGRAHGSQNDDETLVLVRATAH